MTQVDSKSLQVGDWVEFLGGLRRKVIKVHTDPLRYLLACHDDDRVAYGYFTPNELREFGYDSYRDSP